MLRGWQQRSRTLPPVTACLRAYPTLASSSPMEGNPENLKDHHQTVPFFIGVSFVTIISVRCAIAPVSTVISFVSTNVLDESPSSSSCEAPLHGLEIVNPIPIPRSWVKPRAEVVSVSPCAHHAF